MLNVKPLRLVCVFAALTIYAITESFSAPPPQPAAAVPGDSIYQLNLSLTDQQAREFKLAERRGKPMLVTMFYTSCQFVCPMQIEAVRATEAQLSPQERAGLTVLMVSFDPEHDSVSVLQRTATERQLDPAHWTLARADAKSVRKLAAALGVQYRQLPNGDFNHSTQLVIVDGEGRIVAKTPKLGDADPVFVKQVKNVMAHAAHH